jgi:hypothetical protein
MYASHSRSLFTCRNLWVWNAARAEFETAPLKEPIGNAATERNARQLHATFHNTGSDQQYENAKLWYDEAGDFGSLASGKRVSVNTFEGHVWNIRDGDTILKSVVITAEKQQTYSF